MSMDSFTGTSHCVEGDWSTVNENDLELIAKPHCFLQNPTAELWNGTKNEQRVNSKHAEHGKRKFMQITNSKKNTLHHSQAKEMQKEVMKRIQTQKLAAHVQWCSCEARPFATHLID